MISYKESVDICGRVEKSSVFLCGNGFSINFDKDFVNIYNRLYAGYFNYFKYVLKK